jgi:hypothetical protein
MNIRRWLPRRAPLVVATALAITAAVVVAPSPASASTYTYCYMILSGPTAGTTTISANASVYCSDYLGVTSNTRVNLYRDGVLVSYGLGILGAGASSGCVPGTYTATASASVSYPFGNIPSADFFTQQSGFITFNCTVPLTVSNPGNQVTYFLDPGLLQMTATGGTAPYTWSASGLPTGLSINSSTGLISGTVTRIARYAVTVTAVDATGRSASTTFTWNVRGEPCPRC